jgi:hypothetical protein
MQQNIQIKRIDILELETGEINNISSKSLINSMVFMTGGLTTKLKKSTEGF